MTCALAAGVALFVIAWTAAVAFSTQPGLIAAWAGLIGISAALLYAAWRNKRV
jgi:hypothetical protein